MVQSQLTSTLCRFFMWFFGRSLSRLAASLSTWTLETVGGHISVWFSAPYEESFIIFPLPLQNIHTFLQHSSQASPVQKHFITLLVFTFLQFVFNERDCITSAMHRCWLSLSTWSIPKLSDFFFCILNKPLLKASQLWHWFRLEPFPSLIRVKQLMENCHLDGCFSQHSLHMML